MYSGPVFSFSLLINCLVSPVLYFAIYLLFISYVCIYNYTVSLFIYLFTIEYITNPRDPGHSNETYEPSGEVIKLQYYRQKLCPQPGV